MSVYSYKKVDNKNIRSQSHTKFYDMNKYIDTMRKNLEVIKDVNQFKQKVEQQENKDLLNQQILEVKKLNSQINQLKDQNNKYITKNAELTLKNKQLKIQMEELQNEQKEYIKKDQIIDQLEDEFNKLRQINDEQFQKILSQEQYLQQLQHKFSYNQSDSDLNRSRSDNVRSQNQILNDKLQEIELLYNNQKSEIDFLKIENSQIKEELQQYSLLKKAHKNLIEILKGQESKINRLHCIEQDFRKNKYKHLSSFKDLLNNDQYIYSEPTDLVNGSQEFIQKQISSLEEQVLILRQENDAIILKYNELLNDKQEFENSKIQIKNLTAKNKDLIQRISSNQIDENCKNEQFQSLQNQITQLQKDLENKSIEIQFWHLKYTKLKQENL